jgi:NADP-dependent 3-hydroxy acid dehydrogenase YdfG
MSDTDVLVITGGVAGMGLACARAWCLVHTVGVSR